MQNLIIDLNSRANLKNRKPGHPLSLSQPAALLYVAMILEFEFS